MFNFTKKGKLFSLLLNNKPLYASKVPNWLVTSNLNTIFGDDYVISINFLDFSEKSSSTRQMLLDVYNVLIEADFYFCGLKLIPVISKRKKELLGVVFNATDSYEERYFWDISDIELTKKMSGIWASIFSKLNEKNIAVSEDIDIFEFNRDIFEMFYKDENISVKSQERILALKIYDEMRYGNEELNYYQYYLFMNPMLSQYFEKISASEDEAIGYLEFTDYMNLYIPDEFEEVLTLAKESISKYDWYLEDNVIYSNKLGKTYKISENYGAFMYDNVTSRDDILWHINQIMTIHSSYRNTHELSKTVNYKKISGTAIIYDRERLKISGILVMLNDFEERYSNFQKLSQIANIYILDANLSKKLSLKDIVFPKNEKMGICMLDVTHYEIFNSENKESDLEHTYFIEDFMSLIFEFLKEDSLQNPSSRLLDYLPRKINEGFECFEKGEIDHSAARDCYEMLRQIVNCDHYVEFTKYPHVFLQSFMGNTVKIGKNRVYYGSKLSDEEKNYVELGSCRFEENAEALEAVGKCSGNYKMPKIVKIVYGIMLGGICEVIGFLYEELNDEYENVSGINITDTYVALMLYFHFMKFVVDSSENTSDLIAIDSMPHKYLPNNIGVNLNTFEFGINKFSKNVIKYSTIYQHLFNLAKSSSEELVKQGISKDVADLVLNNKSSFKNYDEAIEYLKSIKENGKLGYCNEHATHYVLNEYNMCPKCKEKFLFIKDMSVDMDAKCRTFGEPCKYVSFYMFKEDHPASYSYDEKILSSNLSKKVVKVIKEIYFTPTKKIIGYVFSVNLKNRAYEQLHEEEVSKLSNKDILEIYDYFLKFSAVIDFGEVTNIFDDFIIINDGDKIKAFIKNLSIIKKASKDQDMSHIKEQLFSWYKMYDLNSLYQGENIRRLCGSTLTYCKFHGFWYPENGRCHLCKKENFASSKLRIKDNEKPLSGGEAYVYEIENSRQLFKVWKEEKVVLSRKYEIVRKIIAKKLSTRPYSDYKLNIMFPIQMGKAIVSKEEVIGYIMDRAEDSKAIRILENQDITDKYSFTIEDILDILITLGMGLKYIHENGMYIGDLSGSNIMFDANKNVYILDTDSFGIDGLGSTAFTFGYVDPMAIKDDRIATSIASDYYSFAIIAFLIITKMHPFKGVYLNANGEKIDMKVDERMKNKISVIGNHNIRLPRNISVDEAWGWMSDELKGAFLDIFEHEKRFNITDYLKAELNRLRNVEVSEKIETSSEKINDAKKDVTHEDKKQNVTNVKVFAQNAEKSNLSGIFKLIPGKVNYCYLGKSFDVGGKDIVIKIDLSRYIGAKIESIHFGAKNTVYLSALFTTPSGRQRYKFMKYRLRDEKYEYLGEVEPTTIATEKAYDFIENFKGYVIKAYIGENTLKVVCGSKIITDMLIKNVIASESRNELIVVGKDPLESNKCIIISDVGDSESIKSESLDTFPESIIENNNYCYYNNSFYIPSKNQILAKNVLNGNERIFRFECDIPEAKMICKTPKGFRIYAKDSSVYDITP